MSTIERSHCTLVHHSKETSILSLYVDNFLKKKREEYKVHRVDETGN